MKNWEEVENDRKNFLFHIYNQWISLDWNIPTKHGCQKKLSKKIYSDTFLIFWHFFSIKYWIFCKKKQPTFLSTPCPKQKILDCFDAGLFYQVNRIHALWIPCSSQNIEQFVQIFLFLNIFCLFIPRCLLAHRLLVVNLVINSLLNMKENFEILLNFRRFCDS